MKFHISHTTRYTYSQPLLYSVQTLHLWPASGPCQTVEQWDIRTPGTLHAQPDGQGNRVHSFSLLTVNADGHPLLGRMHRPGDEKRMLVIVPPMHHSAWLNATLAQAQTFMRTTPAEQLTGAPADVPRVQQQAWDF